MKDEELLILYRKYKKKRIIIISGIIVLILLICLIFMYLRSNNISTSSHNESPAEETSIKDMEAPIIKLKTDYLEIMKGDDIDYLSYVESVIDNIDGDLFDKLEYDEIDTSIVGEQSVTYRVSDNSGNNSQLIISVIVKDKETSKENNEGNSSTNVTQKNDFPKVKNPDSNQSNSTQNTESKKPSVSQEITSKNENNPSEKIIKYFLFSDGYTMENVADACASELKKTNKTGICRPLQDENGIYLGMVLETN